MEWTEKAVKQASMEDTDEFGCVLGWHKYNGCIITGYRNINHSELFTHWTRLPKRPQGTNTMGMDNGFHLELREIKEK